MHKSNLRLEQGFDEAVTKSLILPQKLYNKCTKVTESESHSECIGIVFWFLGFYNKLT